MTNSDEDPNDAFRQVVGVHAAMLSSAMVLRESADELSGSEVKMIAEIIEQGLKKSLSLLGATPEELEAAFKRLNSDAGL